MCERKIVSHVTDCKSTRDKIKGKRKEKSYVVTCRDTEALPFETITLDFITKLPESAGSDSILTIVDHDCTKAATFIPCREEITAEETAGLYLKHVFTRYGLPSRIISDRDPRFTSKFTRELCRLLDISQNISTAYHP